MKKFLTSLLLLSTSLPALAGQRAVNCKMDKVQVNWGRIYVKCIYQNGINLPYVKDIPYYSASLSQANSKLMLDVLLKAKELNKHVTVWHSDDPDNNPDGCSGSNCRRLNAAGIK